MKRVQKDFEVSQEVALRRQASGESDLRELQDCRMSRTCVVEATVDMEVLRMGEEQRLAAVQALRIGLETDATLVAGSYEQPFYYEPR